MAGHHETSPYWNTPDVWWPAAGSGEIKLRKSQYLTAGGDAFLGMHVAESAMEHFRDWLLLEEEMKKSPDRKQQPRNAGGVLISAKDNGAGRDAKGRYGGRKRK